MSAPSPRGTPPDDVVVHYAEHDCVCGHTSIQHDQSARCTQCDCPLWKMTDRRWQTFIDLSAKELIEFPTGPPRIPAVAAQICYEGLVAFEAAMHADGWGGPGLPGLWGVRLGRIGPRSEFGIRLADLAAPNAIWVAGEVYGGGQLAGIRGLTHLIVDEPDVWPVSRRRGLVALTVAFEGTRYHEVTGAATSERCVFTVDIDGRFYAVTRDRDTDEVTQEMVHHHEFLARIGVPVIDTVPGILFEFLTALVLPHLPPRSPDPGSGHD